MNISSVLCKAIVCASWFAMPPAISPQAAGLSLQHGIYVLQGVDCEEPPLAAMQSWDGVGFAGPHSSKCTTCILSHNGNRFDVSTTCSALGDGTPDTSGYVDKLSLTRVSNTRFVLHNENKTESSYRWCSAK